MMNLMPPDPPSALTFHPRELAALRAQMDVPADVDLVLFEVSPLGFRGFQRQLSAFHGFLLLSSYPERDDRPWIRFGFGHPDGIQVSGLDVDLPPGEPVRSLECQLWLCRLCAKDGSGYADIRWCPPGQFEMVLMPAPWATVPQVKALFAAIKIMDGLARPSGRPKGSVTSFESREIFLSELREVLRTRKGQPIPDIARALGISVSTLYRLRITYPGVWEEAGGSLP